LQSENVITPPSWLIILIHFSTLLGIFQLFSFMGYGVTFVDFFLSILYLIILKQFVFDKRKFSITDSKVLVVIILLLFAVFFSGIALFFWAGRESYVQYLKTISHFTFVALYGVVTISIEISYKTVFSILRIYLYSSFIINLYAIYQLIARIYFLPLAYIDITNISFQTRDFDREVGEYTQVVLNFENFYRATSIFSEPSALAWFNIYCLVIILIPLLTRNKPIVKQRWLLYFALGMTIVGLFLTFSLTGMLLLFFLILSIVVLEKIKMLKMLVVTFAVMIIVATTDVIQMNFTEVSIAELFYSRITGLLSAKTRGNLMTVGESAPDRIQSIQNAINLFLDYPITGIGSGNTYYYPKSTKRFTQSSFFHLLTETGLIGAFAFLFLTIYFLRIMLYLYKHRFKSIETMPELATLQSFAIYLILIVFFSNIFIGSAIGNYGFWLEIGLILIIYRQTIKYVEQSDKLKKIENVNYSVQ